MDYNLKDLECFSVQKCSPEGKKYVQSLQERLENLRRQFLSKPAISDFSTHYNVESSETRYFPDRLVEVANSESLFEIDEQDTIVQRSIMQNNSKLGYIVFQVDDPSYFFCTYKYPYRIQNSSLAQWTELCSNIAIALFDPQGRSESNWVAVSVQQKFINAVKALQPLRIKINIREIGDCSSKHSLLEDGAMSGTPGANSQALKQDQQPLSILYATSPAAINSPKNDSDYYCSQAKSGGSLGQESCARNASVDYIISNLEGHPIMLGNSKMTYV